MAKTKQNLDRLCRQFASILRGTHELENGVCFVTRERNFRATILGRRTTSPLVRYALFSFEDLDRQGNALCLGETAVFQRQANAFISSLRRQGITVTALHNHWLFENPRLMYIHWESVEPPLTFARKTATAFRLLRP